MAWGLLRKIVIGGMVGWCVIPSTFHHKNKEVTRWIIGVTRDSEKMVTRQVIGEKKEEVGDEWREINAKKVTWVAGSIPPPKGSTCPKKGGTRGFYSNTQSVSYLKVLLGRDRGYDSWERGGNMGLS